MRIMAKYDFKIVATWESKKDNRTEFVYLLEWPDRETMADRWEKFLRDHEWIKIKKETLQWLAVLRPRKVATKNFAKKACACNSDIVNYNTMTFGKLQRAVPAPLTT